MDVVIVLLCEEQTNTGSDSSLFFSLARVSGGNYLAAPCKAVQEKFTQVCIGHNTQLFLHVLGQTSCTMVLKKHCTGLFGAFMGHQSQSLGIAHKTPALFVYRFVPSMIYGPVVNRLHMID